MLDVMLDLETMGKGPMAAIVAIGAVEFDLDAGEIGERFYRVVDLDSAVQAGGVIDAETVMWWLKQSDDARHALTAGGEPIGRVLLQFSEWMHGRGEFKQVRMWGNGAAFDNVILASAYRNLCTQAPWVHWNDRCYRTAKALHRGVKLQRIGTHHHAADDAESQARHLIAMLKPQGAAAVQEPAA